MDISSRKERKYTIVPYQKKWREDFQVIKKEISVLFGNRAKEIMHVGSTAIEGMSGKPTIDVLVIVDSVEMIDTLNDKMLRAGYLALGEYVVPQSRLFVKEKDSERLINVHCFEKNHPHKEEMVVMRDFLRAHPDEARAYANFKINLFHQYPDDYFAYRCFKDPYLAGVKTRAVEWRGAK